MSGNDRPTVNDNTQNTPKTEEPSRFHVELSNFFEGKNAATPKDSKSGGSDKQMERVNDQTTTATTQGDARDPFTYTRKAAEAAAELVNLNRTNDQSEQANARRKELQDTIKAQMEEAKQRADAIAQKGDNSVDSMLGDFNKNKNAQREQLATQLGLDPRTTSTAEIAQKFGNGNTPADQMQKAEELFRLQSELESLNKLRMAPAVVRTQYADMINQGFLESDLSKIGQPNLPVSQANALEAYKMIREAGRTGANDEVKNSADFQRVSYSSQMHYAEFQNTRCREVAEGLQKADELTKAGKNTEAEEQYKAALKKADEVDLRFVMQQLGDPRNQQNPEVLNGFKQIVMAAESARFEYARFLNQQGRYDEALPLLIKVQADAPQLTQNDKAFQDMMSETLRGSKQAADTTDTPQVHITKYQEALQRKDYKTASEEIQIAKSLAAKLVNPEQIDKDVARLDQEKKAIEAQKKALEANKDLSADEKAIEQSRLDGQLKLMGMYQENFKNNKNSKDYINYLDGYCDYLKGDNASAHAKFEAFKRDNPDMAKKDDFHMDDLMEATRHKGWWERNIKKILIGAAIVVGAAVAIGTFGAALPAEAALLTTLGVGAGAFAVGTAAGTAAYVGGTAAFTNEKIGWGTVAEGAKWASLGASFVAPGVGSSLGLTGLGARAFTAGVFTTATVTSDAAIEVATQDKSWGQAFADQANWKTAVVAGSSMLIPGGSAISGGGNTFSQAMRAAGTELWKNKILLAAPSVIGIGMDGYQQAHDYFHYPLDPTNSKDRQEMAEREAAQRAAQNMPLEGQ